MSDEASPALLPQIVPPLLLLIPAATTHGPSLYLASGLFGLVALASVLRIAWLLLRPDKPHRRLVRPLLAAGVCLLALLHLQLSLRPARMLAVQTVSRLQAECAAHRRCPAVVEGWQPRNDRYSSRLDAGRWVKWPLLYHSDGKTFELRLYKLLDIGESWSGGVSGERSPSGD